MFDPNRERPSVARLTTPAVAVSCSANIALYPALAADTCGRLGLAWYEYGSPHRSDRSDVWFSRADGVGGWEPPSNVSAGVSYNNGPSLIWNSEYWLCAWHSWRAPGAEPFVPGGDLTNLWCAKISAGGWISPAQLALSEGINTEYASLNLLDGERCGLLYHDRVLQTQCLSFGASPPFRLGERLPDAFDVSSFADFAYGGGVQWVAFVARSGGIYLTSRRHQSADWTPPLRLDPNCEEKFTRPKISLDADGAIWIACHSNTWGQRRATYRVCVEDSVNVHLEADSTPGNHCWTCNAICIRGAQADRIFSFGPDVFAVSSGVVPITVDQCLYEADRGYGFDRQPGSQLRELGDEVTRGLFFDAEPISFRVDVSPGEYEVEVIYSSWIAPAAGTQIRIEGMLHEVQVQHQRDAIHLMRISVDGAIEHRRLSENVGLDENRPSRVIFDALGNKHLAWTRYGPDRVDVVHATFEW